jgi:hypothetical protein
MKRLILTPDSLGVGWLMQAGITDLAIWLDFRFVWGTLPSLSDLATSLSTRSTKHVRRFLIGWTIPDGVTKNSAAKASG